MDTENNGADTLNMKGIELISVSKSYGGPVVVSDLSLAINRGEMFCLLGPSGCGKTTILKIIAGLIDIDRGKVLIEGQDITKKPPQKRGVGLVFQNYALFPHISVFENVAYGLRCRRISVNEIKRQVEKTLEFVRLTEYGTRRIHQLSGGEQQRVALARALAIRPHVLLLDEPLSNLDARLRTEIRKEIRRIQKELNLTAVYVTHDQEEAMSIADRIGVMNKGKLEQIGLPQQIYNIPATRFVADFIGTINFIPRELVANIISSKENCKMKADKSLMPNNGLYAVRPENIRLERSADAPHGVIREIIYLGSLIRYSVSLLNTMQSQEVVVEIPVSQNVLQVGDSVRVHFQSEDILLFPDKE